MPYEDPDPLDPMTLEGVAVDVEDEGAVVEMAACFIDEYFRLGFSAERVFGLFQAPGYAGPGLARRRLGESRIRALIDEAAARWGPRRPGKSLDVVPERGICLPVLDGTTF